MFIKHFTYVFGIILLWLGSLVFAQQPIVSDSIPPITLTHADSIQMVQDSIRLQQRKDSLTLYLDPADRESPTKEVFEDEIVYSADSIVGQGTGVFLLYGNAEVSYGEQMNLKADFIRMDMDRNELFAAGKKDSVSGEWTGKPEFTDGGTSYVSDDMRYNFSSGKAFITNTVTEQGEGFVTSHETKKIDEGAICMRNGKYTTCDNHEHPHFYLSMSKAKVRPGKNIVTGPAHLVIEDVHLPLFIPFGFFPFTDDYSSGFIIPEIGEEQTRGFFLQDGGYYFAINDYFDFKMLGSIYSLGSWDLSGSSKYKKRYKFAGSFSAKYMVNVTGDINDPSYSKSKDFRINWSHRQDAKANMYQTFSASVNFSTSSYDRNNVNTLYNVDSRSRNHKQSSITYSRRFPDSPFSLSGSAMASQNSADTTVSFTLPQVNLSMSRIYPFKRKNKVGKSRWYEKIGMSYTGVMSNSIDGKEDDVFHSDLVRDWSNGIRHSIPISTSFNLLKNITITPSVNYTERWYSSHIEKELVDDVVETDTIWGFNRVYDYSGSVGASTKLYGFYTPWRKLFGNKVEAIRHVFTPSVSASYRPDFSEEKYGFYAYHQQIEDYDVDGNPIYEDVLYSKYSNGLYGNASSGKSGTVSFSLGNNLEMKVRSDKDTVTGFKKIKLIESFSVSSGYNLAIDSMNWSMISTSFRTKLFNKFNLNLRATFDPYMYAVDAKGNAYRSNNTWFQETGKFGQIKSASTSFSYSIDNKKVHGWFNKEEDGKGNKEGDGVEDIDGAEDTKDGEGAKKEDTEKLAVGDYTPFEMPWSLSFSFSYRLNTSYNKYKDNYDYNHVANLRVNGKISLTDKWDISGSSGYDFEQNEITSSSFNISRDLHCWSMNMSLVPFGKYKTYMFTIKVNSSILQDLKYEQRKSPYDPGF